MNHKEFGYIAYYHHLEKLLACNKDFVAYCIQDISFHIDKEDDAVVACGVTPPPPTPSTSTTNHKQRQHLNKYKVNQIRYLHEYNLDLLRYNVRSFSVIAGGGAAACGWWRRRMRC